MSNVEQRSLSALYPWCRFSEAEVLEPPKAWRPAVLVHFNFIINSDDELTIYSASVYVRPDAETSRADDPNMAAYTIKLEATEAVEILVREGYVKLAGTTIDFTPLAEMVCRER